jgi:ubiquinone/menaquinone biosynthesis C-methylase UbiE
MSAYINGILMSQLIWTPHARAFDYFRTSFLSGNPPGSAHLEVGPGHGLFLYFAARHASTDEIEAWDVSEASIAATRRALERLGVERPVSLIRHDVLEPPAKESCFESAIISEVLEHLERPDLALSTLRRVLKPGGRLFINAPVNSPAPDHIYLWRSPREFVDFVEAQGFEIESAQFLPMTGASLQKAEKLQLSISCVLIARAVG